MWVWIELVQGEPVAYFFVLEKEEEPVCEPRRTFISDLPSEQPMKLNGLEWIWMNETWMNELEWMGEWVVVVILSW